MTTTAAEDTLRDTHPTFDELVDSVRELRHEFLEHCSGHDAPLAAVAANVDALRLEVAAIPGRVAEHLLDAGSLQRQHDLQSRRELQEVRDDVDALRGDFARTRSDISALKAGDGKRHVGFGAAGGAGGAVVVYLAYLALANVMGWPAPDMPW